MNNSARTIVIVLHDLPLGGSERIAVRLANSWAEAGRAVTIFCGCSEGPLAELINPQVELVQCNPPIRRGRGSRQRLGRALAAHVAEHRPDVVFVPGNYHWPVLPAIESLEADQRPAIVAQIGTPLYRRGRGILAQLPYNIRTRRQFRAVDHAISLSPSMTRDADRVLGRKITQCVRLPALDEGDSPLPLATDSKLIVAAGRLVPEKGFDVALRAFARVEDDQALLAIVGEGPERQRLLALARRLGIADRVHLPGYVSNIRPWLERARALLLTSHYEGYAAVVVEALGAGRPVVATDCTPAARELLACPSAGHVAPIGDVAGLALGLSRVLTEPQPEPEALSRIVADYRISTIADAYLRTFDAVAARRAASASVARLISGARAFATPASRPATLNGAIVQTAWRRSA